MPLSFVTLLHTALYTLVGRNLLDKDFVGESLWKQLRLKFVYAGQNERKKNKKVILFYLSIYLSIYLSFIFSCKNDPLQKPQNMPATCVAKPASPVRTAKKATLNLNCQEIPQFRRWTRSTMKMTTTTTTTTTMRPIKPRREKPNNRRKKAKKEV